MLYELKAVSADIALSALRAKEKAITARVSEVKSIRPATARASIVPFAQRLFAEADPNASQYFRPAIPSKRLHDVQIEFLLPACFSSERALPPSKLSLSSSHCEI